MEAFVEQAVKSGCYGTASRAVREGLRILEEREAKCTGQNGQALGIKHFASSGFGKITDGDHLATSDAHIGETTSRVVHPFATGNNQPRVSSMGSCLG